MKRITISTAWVAWIAGAIVVCAILLVYFRGGSGSAAAGPTALAGRPAPSFTVASLQGRALGIENFRGRVVVMNLWASWCPPCRAEMPDLERLYQQYSSRGVVVVGIDQGESAQRARAFASSLRIRYPILLDRDQQYGRVYSALGLPTTVVVKRDGVVASGFDGPLSYPQMVAAISPLLRRR